MLTDDSVSIALFVDKLLCAPLGSKFFVYFSFIVLWKDGLNALTTIPRRYVFVYFSFGF
jgi:hypothetical protein